MNPELAPEHRRLRRFLANTLGGIAFLIALAVYAQSNIVKPLYPVWLGGDAIYLFRGSFIPGTQVGGILTGNDFPHIYFGSRLLWEGGNPYSPEALFGMAHGQRLNPYVYLPFTGLIMGPVAAFDYLPNAFLAWFLANHVMIWLAAFLSLAAVGMGLSRRGAVFAAMVLAISAPWFRSLSAGQLNGPLVLAYPLVLLAMRRKRDGLAGFIAAAAALFKLSPGILLLYFLWKRRWRAAGWMAAWGVALMAVSIGWAGWRVHLEFLPLLREMGYGHSTWAQYGNFFYCDPANQSFNSLFHHLFAAPPQGMETTPLVFLGARAANAFTWLVSFSLLAFVLWMTKPKRRQMGHADAEDTAGAGCATSSEALEFSLFIFLSLFLPSLCWDHYLIQLLFPILAIFAALERRRSWPIAVLAVVSLLVVSLPFNFWSPRWQSGPGLLLMSWKLYGALGLFGANVLLLRSGKSQTGRLRRFRGMWAGRSESEFKAVRQELDRKPARSSALQ